MMDRLPQNDLREVWQNQKVEVSNMSVQELRSRASHFQRKIGWRTLREYLAAVFVLGFFGFSLWNNDSIVMRVGAAMVIAGTLYMVVQLRRRGAATNVPAGLGWQSGIEFQRLELERQRDLLRSVWRWYLLPFVPGMVVIFCGPVIHRPGLWMYSAGSLVLCAGFFLLVTKLNHWAANKLQRQIDELETLENEA